MDVDVLLLQFCRSHTLRTWALVGSIQTLDHSCNQLKEISMQFAALVRTLVSDANLGASVRSSRVSSVHESSFSVPTNTNTTNTGN
uniref:Uncharacterized protein n=1 Tax=Panagrolaimus sp. ES5 TaxID=591445 RepID=A0AC34F175_9BILA